MASQNKPQGERSFFSDPVMIGAMFFVVLMLAVILWSKFHTQIATAYSYLRMAQFFFFWSLGEAISFLSTPFHDWFNFFWKSDRSLIGWPHLAGSSFLANVFTLVFVILPVAVFMAKKSLKTNPYNHKHYGKVKDYSLHTFTDAMAAHYPHLKLFRKLNLTKHSINSGKYRMADTEKQFAIKHDLLDRVKAGDYKVNRDRSVEVFRGQLGKLWTGYSTLSRSEYAIIAALIPRLAATDEGMSDGEYKEALATTDGLIAGYWRSAAESYDNQKDKLGIDLEVARESVRKYGKHPKVVRLIKKHAYVSTIIYAMLTEARTLGVLAACDMRWLRVTDRRIWLLFNNVGRTTPFVEVAGAYCHYLHEQRQKRAIERPQIDSAVKGLIEAVDSFKFTEAECGEVEAHLKTREEAEKAMIDMKALEKNRRTLVLAVATVGSGDKADILEAALLAENGDVLLVERCKPAVDIDEDARREFGLGDDDLAGIVKAPEAAKLREKLLELCNGHRVVVFGDAAVAAVPGLERSASEVAVCASMMGADGSAGVYDACAVMQLGVASPGKRNAQAEAMACRQVWIEIQKRALRAQQQAKKGPQP